METSSAVVEFPPLYRKQNTNSYDNISMHVGLHGEGEFH